MSNKLIKALQNGYRKDYADGFIIIVANKDVMYKYMHIEYETDAEDYILVINNHGKILIPYKNISMYMTAKPNAKSDNYLIKSLYEEKKVSAATVYTSLKTASLLYLVDCSLSNYEGQNILTFVLSIEKLIKKYDTETMKTAILTFNEIKSKNDMELYSFKLRKEIRLLLDGFWSVYEEFNI